MFDIKVTDPIIHGYVLLLNTSDIVSRYLEVQLSRLGITPTQFRVLIMLQACHEPPTLTELGERLFRDKRGLSIVIGRMERDGLVKRREDDNDGRAIRVVTTGEGQQLFEKVKQPSREIVHRTMSCFSKSDITLLSELLEKVRRHTLQKMEGGNGQKLAVGLSSVQSQRQSEPRRRGSG